MPRQYPMVETMSSPSNDWANFYQRNQAGTNHHQAALFTDNPPSAAAATVTSTNSTTSSTRLNPEGRVSKPIRRRSRASRRTPTTLLNTDTANFRAMVQQFTGGPAASFPSGASSGLYPSGANFSFGLGPTGQQLVNNSNAVMVPNILQIQQPQQHYYNNNDNNTNAYSHSTTTTTLVIMVLIIALLLTCFKALEWLLRRWSAHRHMSLQLDLLRPTKMQTIEDNDYVFVRNR